MNSSQNTWALERYRSGGDWENKKRPIALGISLLFILSIFILLVLAPFPEYQQVKEVEWETDIFDLVEPPQQKIQGSEREETARDLEVRRAAEMSQALQFETLAADLGDLVQKMEVPDLGGIEGLVAELSTELGKETGGQDDLMLTGDDAAMASGVSALRTRGAGDVTAAAGTGLPSSGTGGGRGGGAGGSLDGGRSIGTGTGITIPFQKFEEEDYEKKKILDPLIAWMKAHRSGHEITVQKFLGYESGDITSLVRFTITNRLIEMYLQVVEETQELTILIVEENSFSKLVDQGISRRSHRLELGRLDRDRGGKIVNIFSTQTSPTAESTKDFMSIFLSWWNDGKPAEK